MLKEFLPAVEWLEQDYNHRDADDMGWRVKPRYNPDGTYPHEAYDLNTYRRGPYQLLDDGACGDWLGDVCAAADATGSRCTHEDHQRYIDCYCFQGAPGVIMGLPWTAEDERVWLDRGEYRGDPETYSKYMRATHPYTYDHAFDEVPNNIDWWREDSAA